MKEHQKEYIKLIDDKFRIKRKYTGINYNCDGIIDKGILLELESFRSRVFISDRPKNYYHKWETQLNSEHLPNCVWLTRKSDSELGLGKSFFI